MSDTNLQFEHDTSPKDIDPEDIRGWNWGAFLLNWIWGVGNNTFIALLTLVPFVGIVMAFVLGAKGNRWAWRNGHWDSLEHFKRVQRKWAIWGVVIWTGVVLLYGGFFGGVFYTAKHSEAYRLAVSRLEANAEAVKALGSPISTGFAFGDLSFDGPSGQADLNFRATGPKAAGEVFVTATKENGLWSIKALTLQVDGQTDAINLLRQTHAMISGPWRFASRELWCCQTAVYRPR